MPLRIMRASSSCTQNRERGHRSRREFRHRQGACRHRDPCVVGRLCELTCAFGRRARHALIERPYLAQRRTCVFSMVAERVGALGRDRKQWRGDRCPADQTTRSRGGPPLVHASGVFAGRGSRIADLHDTTLRKSVRGGGACAACSRASATPASAAAHRRWCTSYRGGWAARTRWRRPLAS
jgi:hypothetical protein